MRSFYIAALVLALAVSVSAQTVEEKCALHFDDCFACLSDPSCGWCEDYCVAQESSLCETEITSSLKACPSEEQPAVAKDKRQAYGLCFGKDCTDCLLADSCTFCQFVDPELELLTSACLPDNQAFYCTDSAYREVNATGYLLGQCPAVIPVNVGITIWLYLSGRPTATAVLVQIAIAMTDLAPVTINPSDLIIQIYLDLTASKKRDLSSVMGRQAPAGADTAVAVAGVTPDPDAYSQSQFDADLASLVFIGVEGLTIISGGARESGVDTSGGGGSGGDDVVSGGALAGIIIACLIAGIIIAAIAVYLYMRKKRGSYPMPFRSPAASFRP